MGYSTTDYFGKPLIISDLTEAIKQTEEFVEFSKSTQMFLSEKIKNKTIKITGLQYYEDLLIKLKTIKNECND
jgi:hypothetical protein